MKIGYARVSTADQNLDGQLDALKQAGCEQVYDEVASGGKTDRPVLNDVITRLRSGDCLIVTKLDRVARSLPHLITLMAEFKDQGIAFQSLTEDINTQTPGGKLLFHIMGAIAEFERDLIRERTMTGLNAARSRGRIGGRPRVMTDDKVDAAKKLLTAGTPSKQVAEMLGVSVPTLYRWVPGSVRG